MQAHHSALLWKTGRHLDVPTGTVIPFPLPISNILLLWIKSSQSKSVSACACLFGKEMLFRDILFVIVMEQHESGWALNSGIVRFPCEIFLTSVYFSSWLNAHFLLGQGTSYILYISVSVRASHVLVTCMDILWSARQLVYIIPEAVHVGELISVCPWRFLSLVSPTLLYPRG